MTEPHATDLTALTPDEVARLLGTDRLTAEFVLALERGETTGDVVLVDDQAGADDAPATPREGTPQ